MKVRFAPVYDVLIHTRVLNGALDFSLLFTENLCFMITEFYTQLGDDDANAPVSTLAAYVNLIYRGDVMDLTTVQSINRTRERLGMASVPDENDVSLLRKKFIERLGRKTNIFAAPVEGATRIACTRALMTQLPLPFKGANKLTIDDQLTELSPCFTTIIPVEIFGPSGFDDSTWSVSHKVMRTLKDVSRKIRGAQDASSTDDVSTAYLTLVGHAKGLLNTANAHLATTYPDHRITHRISTHPNVLGQTKQAIVTKPPMTSALDEEEMTPLEHLFHNYLSQLAVWWMNTWGKHELQQKVDMKNAQDATGARKTAEDFIMFTKQKIESYARAQKFWFKTTSKLQSQSDWIRGTPAEMKDFVNFATVALGNEHIITRTQVFILNMKDNCFTVEQRSESISKSVLSRPKLFASIADCVRKATDVMLKAMSDRRPKQIALAFFAQAVLIDIYHFIETYGPAPKTVPLLFENALLTEKSPGVLLYLDLIDLILKTYPTYLQNTLPYAWEGVCLKVNYKKMFDGNIFFPDTLENVECWDEELNFATYFTLKPLKASVRTLPSTPFSLFSLGQCRDDRIKDLYSNGITAGPKCKLLLIEMLPWLVLFHTPVLNETIIFACF